MTDMNKEDKALRRALAADKRVLPSNFTFRTMNRIMQEAQLREERKQRQFTTACVAMALVVIVVGIGVCYHYLGNLFKGLLTVDSFVSVKPLIGLFVIAFFYTINHWITGVCKRKYPHLL